MSDINVVAQIDNIEKTVMSGLKDFQRCTVERIAQLYRDGKRRVLVSDEVGLGKTLIARGTIAKLAQMRRDDDDNLVKVVYICSNATIADQNLNKLRITNEIKTEQTNTSRLSMQHLNIFNQEHDSDLLSRYIQLIPFTPETSFRVTNGAGKYEERALMYAILKRTSELFWYERELAFILKGDSTSGWEWAKDSYEKKVIECDEKSDGDYLLYMVDKLETELQEPFKDGITCMEYLAELCKRFKEEGCKRSNNNDIIGKLRTIFARISLEKLDPDLVIMDEFQRFNYLIESRNHPDSETGMLVNKFLDSNNSKMLLLSATPYKMYSTLEEIDKMHTDEHFVEFYKVMDFLNETEEEQKEFRTVWSNYSVQLKEFSKGDATLLVAKKDAEDALYKNICRTERVSAIEAADIIDDVDVKCPIEVKEQDIKSYIQAQQLLEEIGASFPMPIDYVKSSPYLMSFMREYKIKQNIEKYFAEHPEEIHKIKKESLWLKRSIVNKFGKIPNGNARLERVMSHVIKDGAELLLWVPPSKPYYPSQGVFAKAENFTKTLLFSSWEMVPRMISGLLSYEVERKTVGELAKEDKDKTAQYFYKGGRRYPPARLNFSLNKGEPKAMKLFCLIYPSRFLTKCYNPIEYLNSGATLKEIEKDIKKKIYDKLSKYEVPNAAKTDDKWYYLAPLLLDGCGYVGTWLNNADELFDNDDDNGEKQDKKGYMAHLKELKESYRELNHGKNCNLGKMPNDLLDVLTDMAIASPAITINRTYLNYGKEGLDFSSDKASKIAMRFINRMNTPESTAAIELACGKKSDEAHWLNLLTYCKQGNIQAMFDEYAHLISNGLDKDEKLVGKMHKIIVDSMNLRTTVYKADTFEQFKARVNGDKASDGIGLRSHFAVAFTRGDGRETDTDRKKRVRNAFNSPFRPFVLASTSIGQEGLDFHNYCRRIVHWNLPSNPIDLEQREGRINRFESLAIRQNVSKRYGDKSFKKNIWKEMFESAEKEENDGQGSDLIPFWGLTPSDDMVKIERIVPMYPYSRDIVAYDRLIRILSLYRLTLGQARQEELLEYILKNREDVDEMKKLFINLSPYYKNGGK